MEYFARPGNAHFFLVMDTLDVTASAAVTDLRLVALNGPLAGTSVAFSPPLSGQVNNGRTIHPELLQSIISGDESRVRFTKVARNQVLNPIEGFKFFDRFIFNARNGAENCYIWVLDAVTKIPVLYSFASLPYNSNCVGDMYANAFDPTALLISASEPDRKRYMEAVERHEKDLNEFTRVTASFLADVLGLTEENGHAPFAFTNGLRSW